MGTGKTPVALAIHKMLGSRKTLIVCPNSLKLEWSRQIQDWMGIIPTLARKGSYRRLETLFDDMRPSKKRGKGGSLTERSSDHVVTPFFVVNF
jgi:hypothetical protein